MKHTQTVTIGFAAVVLCLAVLAGCSSSHHSASAGTTTTTVSATSTTTGGSTITTTGPASPTTTSAPSGPPACLTSQLSGSLGAPGGAAGTIYYQVELRNTGSSACVVQGYPGVSFVAAAGHQVGAPAQRLQAAEPTVTLSPGQTAYALLGIVDAGNFGSSCQLTPVLGLRVYPPGQTSSLYIAHQDQGCANPNIVTLTIDPLNPSPTT